MDMFEAVEKRKSIRKFKPEPVILKDLRRILEAGRLAPSAGNCQPWSFVVVRDKETKRALAVASNNQRFVADAGAVIVALGNPEESREFHKQDPMIAVEHMVLAATALGYGTCWIGAFNEAEVKRILEAPESLAIIALLPVGVPDQSPLARPRKAFVEIFFGEVYGRPLEI